MTWKLKVDMMQFGDPVVDVAGSPRARVIEPQSFEFPDGQRECQCICVDGVRFALSPDVSSDLAVELVAGLNESRAKIDEIL